ncbi:MAG: alpha/beta fold hydrolase, partial [Microbacterium sp.]
MAVHEFGSGDRTAAIVHGISGSGLLWQDFAERLSRRHGMRVLAVDLRGHGSSPRSEHYRLRDFTDDLVETLPTDLDLAIGHSLGGRALADAAERLQPHRAIYLDPALDVDA